MNYFGRLVSNVKGFYDEINAATLTGAIDVVVVKQPDGSFLGSPFHVRFGKLGVLRSREKVVDIEVNGVPVNLHMKLGPAGEAFFVEQLREREDVPLELATSPLPSEHNLMSRGLENLHKGLEPQSLFPEDKQEDDDTPLTHWTTSEEPPVVDAVVDIDSVKMDDGMTRKSPDGQVDEMADDHAVSHSITIPSKENGSWKYPFSDSDDVLSPSPQSSHMIHAQRRNLYPLSDLDSPITSPLMSELSADVNHAHLRNVLSDTEAEIGPKQQQSSALYDEEMTWQWGELPQAASADTGKHIHDKVRSLKRRKSDNSIPIKDKGLYLEDVISADKEVADLYLNRTNPKIEDADSGVGHDSQPRSPVSCTSDKPANGDVTEQESMPTDFSLSLCGNLKHPRYPPEQFFDLLITYEEFCRNPALLSDPKLVIRIDSKYYNWQVAAPFIMSHLVYQKPLEKSSLRTLKHQFMPKKRRGWFSWRSSNDDQESSDEDESTMKKSDRQHRHRSVKLEHDDSDSETSEKYKKVTRLSSDQWLALYLLPGVNDVTFSVTTRYQGTASCSAKIYLWSYSDKIVISDIDGTITRSDVLGQMLPLVGKDWSQSGVASLFTNIRRNGYRFMYLSARAIGQAQITRDFLKSVRQGELTLPDGPVMLSPTSLMKAFQKEVIERKPEEFKIACMRDIKSLYPEELGNPFFSGFGNRINDVWAYRAVGIPISRIFTINYKGEIRHELTNAFTTSYSSLIELVDQMFPPMASERTLASTASVEFSSFTYWRVPIASAAVMNDLDDVVVAFDTTAIIGT